MAEVKQQVCIEIQKGEHVFQFIMPNGATWGAALDASFDILESVQEFSKKAVDAVKPARIHTEEIPTPIDINQSGGE